MRVVAAFPAGAIQLGGGLGAVMSLRSGVMAASTQATLSVKGIVQNTLRSRSTQALADNAATTP